MVENFCLMQYSQKKNYIFSFQISNLPINLYRDLQGRAVMNDNFFSVFLKIMLKHFRELNLKIL